MSQYQSSRNSAARAWWREKIRRPIKRHEWAIIAGLWAIAFALGVWGIDVRSAWSGAVPAGWHRIPEAAYRALHLFTFWSPEMTAADPWQLEVARWIAPAIAAYTAGKGLTAAFYEQSQRLRACASRDHVIVCGLSDKGHLIARSFLDRGERVVIIEQQSDRGVIATPRSEGAIVICGDASNDGILMSAAVHRARLLIATCDDDTNAEIVAQARQLLRKKSKLDCLVHISDLDLLDASGELAQELHEPGRFSIRFFNLYAMGARALLADHPPFGMLDGTQPILAVALDATDAFGEHVVREIAMRWAVRTGPEGGALPILPLDETSQQALSDMVALDPALARLIEVGPVFEPPGAPAPTIVYVLDTDPADSAGRAMELRESIPAARIVVRLARDGGLAHLIRARRSADRPPIDVFTVYEQTCSDPDVLLGVRLEDMARALHEFYLAKINPAAAPWDALPETYRDASRRQAEWIVRILADGGFDVSFVQGGEAERIVFTAYEVESLSRVEHLRWCAERLLDGWRYAPVRDNDAKLHPSIVPWERLSDEVRDYDRRFIREWPAMLGTPEIGLVIGRRANSALGAADTTIKP